ncbi:rotatin-like isoform X2 [Babylonia areolata]|uniref:rotatin-like isoform X2 n=1 Tax=Babylonia areolata TaxID=304850 RepID=UPI003FD3280B
MAVFRQDIDFQSLFRKLGHHLEEIRVRALNNINSKLEHHLICEQDIIHERHLIIRLLEWFNFTPCSKKEDVLQLLCRLSQHWGAAELIQGVGGIEFLSHLREDVETSLQPIIDQILENVMRLPDVKDQEHAPECIYHKPADSAVWGNTVDENNPSHVSMATATSHLSSLPSVTAEKLGRHDDVSEGYFQGRGESSAAPGPQPDLRPEHSPVGFKMSTFPWLPLTRTDRYVLQSTNRSLQSRDVWVLTSACEFLSDVAFQDFPAEIFLQRPLIVKSLLGLLAVGGAQGAEARLVVCAARTLSHLCACLQTRIRFYQDPVLYTPKQDFTSSTPTTFSLTGSSSSQSVHSSDTRPSLIGWSDRRHRGDGRDGDSSDSASGDSSVGLEPPAHGVGREVDVDEADSLQFLQLSLPQFAATVLLQSLQSLRTSQQSVATELVRLGFEAWRILVVVVAEDLWTSGSESAREQVSKLKSCLETCGSLLHYHHHHGQQRKANTAAAVSEDQGDSSYHRRVYLGVASLLSHLLHLLPHDQAVEVIPDQLHDTLGSLLFDESLALSYPQCHGVLTHFAHLLDLDAYRHYLQASHLRQSMQDTCRFVLQARAKTLEAEEAVTLADSAVTSLPYHLHLPFISQFVAFFSHLSSRQNCDKGPLSRCVGTLLKLLSHPLTEVRQHTYLTVFSTLQSCLNPASEAASTKATGHLGARFILNKDLLYEIVCFGLADSDNKVSSLAMELLFHLLQSQLLLGEVLWGELVTALMKSMPVLQSYADLKGRFGRRLWAMLDPAVTSDHLCLTDKLRGNLRLMLAADAGLREEAVKRLCWFLAHESGSSDRLPDVGEVDVRHLSSLFIVDTPHHPHHDSSRSIFQVEGMKQVYDIFTADPVDAGVKKSAAEQLAIMLQDPHLQAAFRQFGGVEVVLSTVHQAMTRPAQGTHQNPSLALVPACVTILRHLLHHDYTLRHNLTHDPDIYYDLVRASVLLVRDESVSYQVSHLLTLLLFDEVAKFDVGSSQTGQADRNFSLPAVVPKRYRLPFRPTVHHTVSPSAVLCPPEHDVLLTPDPQEMLRVAWNVAWCGGLDPLLQLLKTGGSRLEELRDFSKAMLLTARDRAVLMSSGLRWSLQEQVHCVANAVSHAQVVAGLNTLLAVMATIPSAECVALFNELSWSDVIHRFLQVTPSSPQDEELLVEVLRFIVAVMGMTAHLPQQLAQWLAQRLYDSSGPLMGLLHRAPPAPDGKDSADSSLTAKRCLNKVSLQFIATFISRLPYRLHTRVSVPQRRGELIHTLLQHLSISDAPHFYNLAALEGILVCMMHLTARPGWSEECSHMEPAPLCSHVLNCLLEVVSAFHIGRGGTSMSYIGRGVTKAATLCLRHLAHEMVLYTDNKEWARNWLYSRQGADAEAEPGLNWMLTLWAYRDAEVRAAGLGIAVALTSSEVGRMLVTSNCRHIPGGIWGAAFSILLDPSECSAVRQQAALLLVNLTSKTIPTITLDSPSPSSPPLWQGPVVMDVESNVSVVGLNALLALLHHSHFYQQLTAMLTSFFSSAVLQPVMVTTQVPLHSLHTSHSSSTASVCSTERREEQGGDSARTMDQEAVATSARSTGESARSAGSQVSLTSSSSGLQLDSTSSSSAVEGGGGGEGVDPEGMSSVVTPCLVAAVTQLLGNLVVMAPQDTFNSLAAHNVLDTLLSLMDTGLLQDLCRQLTSGPHPASSLLTLRDLLRMYDAVVCLLRTCVIMNSPTRAALLANHGALKAVASFMLLQCDSGGDVVMECRQLWLSVVRLLCSLLQTQSAAALHALSLVLRPLWTDFCDALVHLMETRTEETGELFISVTSFLTLLLTEEGKHVARDSQRCHDNTTLTYLLDVSKAKRRQQVADKEGERTHFTTGASLAKVLVSTYELTAGSKVGSKGKGSGQAVLVIGTLKSLLAVSQSAKFTALDMGLVETLVDNMKQIHARLSLDSVHPAKAGRKKEDGVLQELVFTVNILRNLICGNEQAKLACQHSGLGGVVHKLWAWCLQEHSLMAAVLSLLINFTTSCPPAASSLAATASGVVGPSASRQQLVSNSLVVAVVKAAQREMERELSSPCPGSPHLKLYFTLLTSLALAPECRSLIWKSNLLQEFSKLSPSRSRKWRSRQLLDSLWLQLAVGLSFSTDGQSMLLRVDECLTVLLDFMENGFASPHCQECAVLVLRNMCCHAANKPKLLANENVIRCCVEMVEDSDNSQLQTLAASALWALAHNNHKAKVAMKGVNTVGRMRACLKTVQAEGHSMEHVTCSQNIQALITTLTT